MKLKKLLTEESVRNKDRMAVDPILLLTTPELLDVLQEALKFYGRAAFLRNSDGLYYGSARLF